MMQHFQFLDTMMVEGLESVGKLRVSSALEFGHTKVTDFLD